MKPVTFHVFFTEDSEDLGLERKFARLPVQPITFFHIDAIYPYSEDEHRFTNIVTGGVTYVARESPQKVRDEIDKARRKELIFYTN